MYFKFNYKIIIFKIINEDEKKCIDHLIDYGQQMAGSLDCNVLHSLYKLIILI